MQNRAKSCQNRAAKVKMIQKRASQGFLDPIQKRARSRSVQLEAVYLEALLYQFFEALFSRLPWQSGLLFHGYF